jgi:hypothetical protein
LLWSSLLRTLALALVLRHIPSLYPLDLYTMPATKRKSDAMDVTPTGSPTKKMRLTQRQKQALMDNLQLESGWNCGFTVIMALILLQSPSGHVSFVLNMPFRQMTSGRALSDASIASQCRYARPTSASCSKNTMPPQTNSTLHRLPGNTRPSRYHVTSQASP